MDNAGGRLTGAGDQRAGEAGGDEQVTGQSIPESSSPFAARRAGNRGPGGGPPAIRPPRQASNEGVTSPAARRREPAVPPLKEPPMASQTGGEPVPILLIEDDPGDAALISERSASPRCLPNCTSLSR